MKEIKRKGRLLPLRAFITFIWVLPFKPTQVQGRARAIWSLNTLKYLENIGIVGNIPSVQQSNSQA